MPIFARHAAHWDSPSARRTAEFTCDEAAAFIERLQDAESDESHPVPPRQRGAPPSCCRQTRRA